MDDVSPEGAPPFTIEGYSSFVEIDRGGASVVYSAVQELLARPVAVKVLNVDLHSESARRRFERECAVVGALGDAPGIVAVHATAFTDDGRGCIVMRLMEESTAALLRRSGPLDPDTVRRMGVVIAGALAHAHRNGVVHRDVKPANILVSQYGEMALADFDIATVGELSASTMTQESMSPPHAPPERFEGDTPPGPAGDIWSLGSTMFTLLEGRPPFGTASDPGGLAGLIDRVRNSPTPPLSRTDVAPRLEEVIRRCLEKSPERRWEDAGALRQALQELAPRKAEESKRSAQVPSNQPSSPPASTMIVVAVVVAVVLILALYLGLR